VSTGSFGIPTRTASQQYTGGTGILGLRLSVLDLSNHRRMGECRFGARQTLTVFGSYLGRRHVVDRLCRQPGVHVVRRVMLGFGEGATFPTATRAMSDWTAQGNRGFAQGITHSSARLGNALTPPLVVWLMTLVTWRGSFIVLGLVSLSLGGGLGFVFSEMIRVITRAYARGA